MKFTRSRGTTALLQMFMSFAILSLFTFIHISHLNANSTEKINFSEYLTMVLNGNWNGYPASAACGSTTVIEGTVYEDLNQDGDQDALEVPFFGVTVTAYDDSGVFTTATTDANGEYTLSGLTAGTIYRVEFTNPAGMEEGPHGSESSTSVQFVEAGTCEVDYSLVDPNHFCGTETNPLWVIPCYISGDPQHMSNENTTAIAQFNYAASGQSPEASYTPIVYSQTVGSVSYYTSPSPRDS